MKIIATIFQCKRVVFPYFFIKYCVPKMRELSGFDIDVYLIQHNTLVPNNNLLTFKDSCAKLENVRSWTKDGCYKGSQIIQHTEIYKNCPTLPSYRKGVEIFLREKGDLHIWLEDDALILDRDIKKWLEIKEAGTYQSWFTFIPIRHTITTRVFDDRMLELMEKEDWDMSKFSRIDGKFIPEKGHPEYFMTECCKEKRTELDPKHIAYEHISFVNPELIKSIVPQEEIKLFNLDFNHNL